MPITIKERQAPVFQPPVIGHRGACGYAPENTMASFVKAAQLGIKWIEFDVMLAASGEAVIIHDEKLNRTTNGRGFVQDYPLAYLRSLDAGSWFAQQFSSEPIPTLFEVLDLMQDTNLSANIELKPQKGLEERLVSEVLTEIKNSELFAVSSERILFSSFSIPTLHLLRKHAPDCHIGLLIHDWTHGWRKTGEELKCVTVHVNHKILTKDKAHEIKAAGKSLLSYTVNDPRRARELFSFGCDAVFSDFPDLILSAKAGAHL